MKLVAEPLTAEAFAPYGDVLERPADGRVNYDRSLRSARPRAWPSVGLVTKQPEPAGPLLVRQMERHEFSSQTFVPMGEGRWLVLVAPHAPGGGPDMSRARAFLPGPGQAVTYGADVWHHGLTVFDTAQSFAIVMWMDGTKADAELVDLAEPAEIAL